MLLLAQCNECIGQAITTLTINLFHYIVTLVAVCQLLLNKRIWYGMLLFQLSVTTRARLD